MPFALRDTTIIGFYKNVLIQMNEKSRCSFEFEGTQEISQNYNLCDTTNETILLYRTWMSEGVS